MPLPLKCLDLLPCPAGLFFSPSAGLEHMALCFLSKGMQSDLYSLLTGDGKVRQTPRGASCATVSWGKNRGSFQKLLSKGPQCPRAHSLLHLMQPVMGLCQLGSPGRAHEQPAEERNILSWTLFQLLDSHPSHLSYFVLFLMHNALPIFLTLGGRLPPACSWHVTGTKLPRAS